MSLLVLEDSFKRALHGDDLILRAEGIFDFCTKALCLSQQDMVEAAGRLRSGLHILGLSDYAYERREHPERHSLIFHGESAITKRFHLAGVDWSDPKAYLSGMGRVAYRTVTEFSGRGEALLNDEIIQGVYSWLDSEYGFGEIVFPTVPCMISVIPFHHKSIDAFSWSGEGNKGIETHIFLLAGDTDNAEANAPLNTLLFEFSHAMYTRFAQTINRITPETIALLEKTVVPDIRSLDSEHQLVEAINCFAAGLVRGAPFEDEVSSGFQNFDRAFLHEIVRGMLQGIKSNEKRRNVIDEAP